MRAAALPAGWAAAVRFGSEDVKPQPSDGAETKWRKRAEEAEQKAGIL